MSATKSKPKEEKPKRRKLTKFTRPKPNPISFEELQHIATNHLWTKGQVWRLGVEYNFKDWALSMTRKNCPLSQTYLYNYQLIDYHTKISFKLTSVKRLQVRFRKHDKKRISKNMPQYATPEPHNKKVTRISRDSQISK